MVQNSAQPQPEFKIGPWLVQNDLHTPHLRLQCAIVYRDITLSSLLLQTIDMKEMSRELVLPSEEIKGGITKYSPPSK
jgi:hypothetical protein